MTRMAAAVAVLAILAVPPLAAPPAAGAADAEQRLSTPQLIDAAVDAGRLSETAALRLRALALTAPALVPSPYRSTARWDGTLEALRVAADATRLGERERALVLGPAWPTADTIPSAGHFCFASASVKTHVAMTPHFFVEYDDGVLAHNGIPIGTYLDALEEAWATHVERFGWAPPPVYRAGADPDSPWAEPAPGGRYHVRIDVLPPGLYGQVAAVGRHAGNVRDNPATPWDDHDAHATCMLLNADFPSLSDDPVAALRATVAHELHHALQVGIGAILEVDADGEMTELDAHVAEATAVAMEDEVFDDANDVYHQLWPAFEDDMGEHEGDPYRYWLTWRGVTESFGTTRSGGAEQVLQDLYERLSRRESDLLDAVEAAFAARGTALGDAFHRYAVAVRFLRPCPARNGRTPPCLEEGEAYLAAGGRPPVTAAVQPGGAVVASVPDNYALDHIGLPRGRYRLRAENTDVGGVLRLTAACARGDRLRLMRFPSLLPAGAAAAIDVDVASCDEAFLVVTNEGRSGGANPTASVERTYRVQVETSP